MCVSSHLSVCLCAFLRVSMPVCMPVSLPVFLFTCLCDLVGVLVLVRMRAFASARVSVLSDCFVGLSILLNI